ncbi:L-serine ammonia-lyase, iron-sulfur-dependent, subunit alpha [uncultured Intestinimonas sp.]|uniref:L-cysteine desulfidase family protein n=1 Tax=uncultured Intestinimonas sp. TaxID=1689265 RepID=UPI0025FED213|nr:L-serine ammonia-lyase, iron-sulfur-dependent, subunit alpha [uncultured Intestinimonas sp.]
MNQNDPRYAAYLRILAEELVPAMGCTEPISISFCAAKARELLGALPEAITVAASGNIIKNVKSVVVPNTGGRKGIETAAAVGVVAGDPSRELEVIASVTPEQREALGRYLETVPIQVLPADTDLVLDVTVTVCSGGHSASVRVANQHTNIVSMVKDGETLFEAPAVGCGTTPAASPDRALMDFDDIFDFADTVDIEDVKPLLDRQIAYNTAISREGLQGDWGANIGSTLLKIYGDDVKIRARAAAAAGSDARMSGCELPVVINSGSGNQGMTVSLPVIEYARELNSSPERLYRALTLSNLTAIYQKEGIGRLSAYCGAISAGASAGAGIAYLLGGGRTEAAHTIVNALAITSGIICDGAKASCAGKIAAAVDAGILGYYMFLNGQEFHGGDGIISKGIESTLRNVTRLGKEGMKETDEEIIRIMTGC